MAIRLSDHFNFRRLFRFCLPPIVMMVFTSIYSVVDGFFVSNWAGKTSFAAINLIYPFIAILGGVGFMMGAGGSALVAKTLGEGDRERADRYFSLMVAATAVAGVILSAAGILLLEPIARRLGATEAMMGDCVVYGSIILAFNTAFMLQNLFQTFLTTAQKPKLGLLATVAAGVTNMVLDYLLVAVAGLGVVGAALATGISQTVGGLLPLIYFLRPNTSLLRLVRPRLEWRPLLHACANGVSELMSSISGPLVSMLYNARLMALAGENGVSAYGVLMYLSFTFVAVFIGYTIGTAPVIGYHFGAGSMGEVRNVLRKSVVLMVLGGVVMTALAEAGAAPLARIFVGYDGELWALTTRALRIYALHFVMAGIGIFTSSFFTALNNGAVSAVISFLRTLVFQTSWVMVMPVLFGVDGIWWAVVAAEVCSFGVSLAFLAGKKKKYGY